MNLAGLPLFGRLDRWVLRSFVLAYVVGGAALLFLFVVFDMSARLDDLTDEGLGTTGRMARMGWYYLLMLPDLHHQAAPFVSLGAGLYTAARVVGSREWLAVVMAGVPSARLFLPVLLVGTLLAFGSSLARERASETFGAWRAALTRSLDPDAARRGSQDLWLRTTRGAVVFVGRSRLDDDVGEPRLEGIEAPVRLPTGWGLLRADVARFDDGGDAGAEAGRWRLEGGTLQHLDEADGLVTVDLTRHEALDFEPVDVELAMRARDEPQTLSGGEAARLLARDPDSTILATVVEVHRAAPWLDVLFLLMALPFAIRTTRPALFRGVLQAVVLCCGAFVAVYFARSLGMQGDLAPAPAAWAPIGLCALLGAVLYARQRT